MNYYCFDNVRIIENMAVYVEIVKYLLAIYLVKS